ncbi:MAG: helix-turn-helix domain-containing protein [Polyangiales bacterium]
MSGKRGGETLTHDRRARIVAAYAELKSIKGTAARFGLAADTIKRVLREAKRGA